MRNRVSKTAAAAGTVVALLAAGAAYAAIGPSADGIIYACYNTTTGAMRMIDSATTCPSGEKNTYWNQRGRQGPTGHTGAKGETGAQGPPGETRKYWVKLSANGALVATNNPNVHIFDKRAEGGDGFVYFPGSENRNCALTVTPEVSYSTRQVTGVRVTYSSQYWVRFNTIEAGRTVAVPVDVVLHCA